MTVRWEFGVCNHFTREKSRLGTDHNCVAPNSVMNHAVNVLKDLQPTACTYAGLADAIRAAVKANRREAAAAAADTMDGQGE